jgi:hypothetical protein
MKKFLVTYPEGGEPVPRDESEIGDIFTEQWRASSSCVIAASKLNVSETVKVCGVTITRTE